MKKLKQNIDEVRTTKKDMYGQGMEHEIYASKTNPNVLFKVGHKDVVDEWLDVFQSNPSIFPKVFNWGKMKDRKFYYVEIEKVDTKKFEKDWDELELALEDVGVLDVDRGQTFSDLYMNEGSDSAIFVEIAKKLKEHDARAYDFFIKFLTVIKECEREIMLVMGKDTLVDAHKYNFGYGGDGKIKCIDL